MIHLAATPSGYGVIVTGIDERAVALDGVDNARDIGGLPLRGGGRTRRGVLLRTGSLLHLTPDDVQHLLDEFGLRLVLDLRTPREIDRDGPTAVARAGVETVGLTFIGSSRQALPEDEDPTMLQAYRGYLADHPGNIVEAVRRIADADGGPTIVHCLAGKDRTGTLVALVLDAVGVEREAVVADYAASAANIEAMFLRWTRHSGEPMPDDLDRHRPVAATMTALLAELDAEYGTDGQGGAQGWLLANGLTEAELAGLRARLRDPVD